MGAFEAAKGKIKEVAGDLTNDEALEQEGTSQQEKGKAEHEADKARAEAKAREAEAKSHEAKQSLAEDAK